MACGLKSREDSLDFSFVVNKKAIMVTLRCFKRPNIFCFVFRYLVPLAFVLYTVYFSYNYHQITSLENKMQDLAVSTSIPLLTVEDLKNAFIKGNGFLAAKKKNLGKPTGSAVCVVDPAVTDCTNMGFAALLLSTLEHILLCRALGIDRPIVYWRACNSVCSEDPRVNSWDWYFETVNHGLESKVENVLCPLKVLDGWQERLNRTALSDVKTVIDNSFKNRTDVGGFEDGKIITTQERMRINKLLQQYVKPNSRIREKVRTFYHRYLAEFTVLGVHVRGTDHWMETNEQKLPSLMSWVERAQSILETLPRPRKIFIASDNNEVIKKFVTYFGKEMVS